MTTRGVRLLGIFVALLALSALAVLPAMAAEPETPPEVRVVRLSLAQGDVQINRNVGVGWEQAINNMPLPSGTQVYAAEDSRAEVELEDGSSIRLAGPAQIGLDDLSLAPDGSPINDIEIDSGLIYIHAENAQLSGNAEFHIQDANGDTFAILAPSQIRFKVDEQVASLAVMDGEVQALDASTYTVVRSGESYNYIPGQPASAMLLHKILPESADAWNQQRDQYHEQYAPSGAAYSGEGEAYGESGYDYGSAADLGYYGTYEDIPGYGESWQPYDVGPDWSPFDYGAWCYYPVWGWTFVSAYPWGWGPFYFGDWFYMSGRGWWWHPGPHHHRFHHGPHGLGGFHPRPLLAAGAEHNSAGHNFRLPQPPSGATSRRTVALAGSNLRVGPIGVTHASLSGSFATARGGAPARSGPASNLARPGLNAGRVRSFAAHPAPGAVRRHAMSGLAWPRESVPRITGHPGSYVVHGSSGLNGYEVRRPSEFGGSAPRTFAPRTYLRPAPRSYLYSGHIYSEGSAPRVYSAPSVPIERAAPIARAPAPMSTAPRIGSGFSGSEFHGGNFGGGAVHSGGFGGGGFGGGFGGGSHGGGARR